MKIRTTQLTVAPSGAPIFSEQAYTVTIDDQAAGEYVVVHAMDGDAGKLTIEPQDWPALREAIDTLIGDCQS
jgi:hypothetical protein